MKPVVIVIMLALATTTAVWLHAGKMQASTADGVIIAKALAGVQACLKPDQSIKMGTKEVPGETFLLARLALAPRHVELFDSRHPPDTLLFICGRESRDTAFSSRKILWMQTDDHFRYQLLGKP